MAYLTRDILNGLDDGIHTSYVLCDISGDDGITRVVCCVISVEMMGYTRTVCCVISVVMMGYTRAVCCVILVEMMGYTRAVCCVISVVRAGKVH
ncbi:UNVERIFIED_CONTAM: hypothetical protein Sradi_2635400 [Sesamum radiatum]|uniref:Uncharacterized protein n=1 Tax=Sesamum radiatum TaxID=300843 RepID=A0AAW2S757_SESRA